MSETTLHTAAQKDAVADFNVYELFQSETVGKTYRQMLDKAQGAMSVSYGNSLENKFNAALLHPATSPQQRVLLERIATALVAIDDEIPPPKLKLTIHHGGSDGEIYIVRDGLTHGIAKLILNEDGLLALSFVSNESARPAIMESFYDADEPVTTVDFEDLMYRFLSL